MAGLLLCCVEGCSNNTAKYVRSTQFAGDHPYCEQHAKLEKDFMNDDASCSIWETVKEYNKRLEDNAKRKKKELEKYENAKKDITDNYDTALKRISFTYGMSVETLEKIYNEIDEARTLKSRKFFGLRIP